MRRFILIAFSILFISTLFVSCNDGTEGLFQMAANSVKKEEYSIKQIINKNGNRYVVTTDNGIALYDVSSRTYSSFKGTGVQATNAIWASADGSSFVYYDTITDKYYNQDGESLSGKCNDYIPKPFYSPDGEHFTYVFQKKSDSTYSFSYMETPAASFDQIFDPSYFKQIDVGDIKGVSIIGNGVFSVAADKYYIYYSDGNKLEVPSPALGYLDDIYLLYDGNLWSKSNNKSFSTIATHINPVMFKGTDYSYFIIQGSSVLYQINEESGNPTVSSIAISGLQNVEIVSIIGQDGRKLQVLTSNSGLRTIDLSNNTIN
ncbi:MAG: hypothetical protein SPF69_08455 [Candidatus Ornithospirochaeta sp.]|nr:hypothetical protein [Sphaerochaetaceae bacterium]MDY5524097.1 hypothetical protein [Candidatus Ornithospirochaeta sp.]